MEGYKCCKKERRVRSEDHQVTAFNLWALKGLVVDAGEFKMENKHHASAFYQQPIQVRSSR